MSTVIVTVGTFCFWWVTDSASAGTSAGVAVLAVTAPVALAIAVPSALSVGRRRGRPIGLTFSGLATLAVSRRIDTVILDADGTVTTGELVVVSVDPVEADHLSNLRWFAGALEHASDTPIGHAIAKLAGRGQVTEAEHVRGAGISGSVDRHPVRIGRPSWIGVDPVAGVGTTVAVEVDGRLLGLVTVADAVRAAAREGVDALRAAGLEPILVSDLTVLDTERLAEQVGVSESVSGADADARVRLVDQLRAEGRTVAMIGSKERNDSALDAADLAIKRSDVRGAPFEGITLDDLEIDHVVRAISLTRSTHATALAGRRWALAAIIVPTPVAAAGLVEPVAGLLISAASAVLVALHSLRIRSA